MITYTPLKSNASHEFERFFEIYKNSINEREQKTKAEVSLMPLRSDYKILLLIESEIIIGFSILYCNEKNKLALLEYMAIDEAHRSKGLGGVLLKETFESLRDLKQFEFGILEVDSPYETSPDQKLRESRVKFYTKNGCLIVDQLNYILPLPGVGAPPEMLIMIYPIEKEKPVSKNIVKNWLTVIYENVYACPSTDPRIDFMLKNINDPVHFKNYKQS